MAESLKIELGGLLTSWYWGSLIGWFVMDAANVTVTLTTFKLANLMWTISVGGTFSPTCGHSTESRNAIKANKLLIKKLLFVLLSC